MVSNLDKGESNRIAELSNGMKMIIARTYSMKDLSDELGITTAELNKGATALAKYNIEVVNTDGSLKPFGDVLGELSGKWSTMSEAEQSWLAESLAGGRKCLARIYRNVYKELP